MLVQSLLLSSDSMIVAVALSAGMPRRQMVPLALLLGACDAVGSAIGAATGGQIAAGTPVAGIFLMLWGSLIVLQLPAVVRRARSAGWCYLLPPLLAIDNLAVASDAPLASGLLSSCMAALGFVIGCSLFGRWRVRPDAPRWVGVPLIVGGLLLFV